MDNLKAQTQSVLTKVLEQMSKQKQEDQKNQLANPQSQVVPVTCKQLIELYSHNMQAREKMLLQVALASDLSEQMNTVSFRQKISKTLQQINLQHNQFNIPQSQLPPSLMNKTSKQRKQTPKKKTEPTVDSNPQYFRVDHEICNKLFMHYKLLPLGTPSVGGFNFEQKQHHKNSMNYHKILEIFKDAKIELEINQKLLILRSIKKFSFNQNFISSEEFLKVFKVIVHGLGFKEQIFQQFIKRSSIQKQYNAIKNKNSIQKPRRNYRFKTDNSALQHKTTLNTSKIVMQPIALQNKRVGTDKNEKKVISNKNIPKTQANNVSYLAKAMEGQKISKISWDSLFNMKQSNMHSFIVIPDFVRNVQVEDF